jgi:PAS domain S-box-containing protein
LIERKGENGHNLRSKSRNRGGFKLKPYLSIRQRLTLLISGLIIVVVAISVAVAYREVRRSLIRGAGQRLESIAAQLGEIFATSTGRLRDRTKKLAEDVAIRSALRNPTPELLDRALATMRGSARPASTAITELWNAEGRRLLATAEVPPLKETFSRENMALLAHGAQVAVGSIQAGIDSLIFPVIAKVTEGGELLGHIVHLHPLEESSQQLGKLIEYHERNATVSLLSLEESSQQLSKLIGNDARFYLGNTQGELWTDLNTQVLPPRVDARRRSGLVEYDPQQNGARLAAFAPVSNTPWTLMVEFPLSLVLAPAKAILWWLGLCFGLLLIVGWVSASLLSRSFTRPLAELADAAQAISTGDYSRQVTATRKDELGAVGRAFNHMVESITGAKERLQQVIASSGAVIYKVRVVESTVTLEWISENVTRILGYDLQEAYSPGWWLENLHPEDRERIMGTSVAYPSSDTIREYRFRHKDGSYPWIRDEVRVLPSSGSATEFVGAMMDFTRQHQLENQFRQIQKLDAVGRLAGGVAHDFNNLLTIILGECDLTLETYRPEGKTRTALEEIRKAGERAALLTRQLLMFSRKQMVEPTTLNPNKIVNNLRTMFSRLIGEDVELKIDLADDLHSVTADQGQIEQVLLNLVVNARDAMPQGGTILIQTTNVELSGDYAALHADVRPGEYAMLAVSDTGTGISKEVKVHLFEPFFTTKERGKGTGLGLATSYAIVKQFGGHIGVYSELGKGTTMKVYLPRTAAQATAADVPDPASIPGGKETILLVEDESAVRAIAGRILAAKGYTVMAAGDGEEALKLLGQFWGAVHLLLTDVVLPKIGGRELAERVRELHPKVKVLFASGYTDDVILQHKLLEHNIALLHKPFTPDGLARKVRETLDQNSPAA